MDFGPIRAVDPRICVISPCARYKASTKIAVGLVRLDCGTEVVQHADLCPVRARERAILRIRDGVTHRVWPGIPDWAVSKPLADEINAIPALARSDLVNVAAGATQNAVLHFSLGHHMFRTVAKLVPRPFLNS